VEQHELDPLQRHELHTERHFWLDGSYAGGHDDLFDHLCRCGRQVARGKRDGDGHGFTTRLRDPFDPERIDNVFGIKGRCSRD